MAQKRVYPQRSEPPLGTYNEIRNRLRDDVRTLQANAYNKFCKWEDKQIHPNDDEEQ